jgi:hypothetical protein
MAHSSTLKIETDTVSLSVTKFEHGAAKRVGERLADILELLDEILNFDQAQSGLLEDLALERQQACYAMDLKYQILLRTLTRQAALARKIAESTEVISDHGFPEFEFKKPD